MTDKTWLVRNSALADADFREIVRWTAERFGVDQARGYADTLADALAALKDGPRTVGAKARDDIGKGIYTLHVARNRRRGRHFILFGTGRHEGRQTVDVLRVLHDAMDLSHHVPPRERSENEG